MKSIESINAEKQELLKELEGEERARIVSKIKEKLDLLKVCVMYLRTDPKEDYLISEEKRISTMIQTRIEMFDEKKYDKLVKSEVSKIRNAFYKGWDIPHLKTQLKTIQYLLS